MKLADIKDVLTFAAFRPEADDRRAPWGRRFVKRRTLLLNIGRGQTSWKAVGKDGRLYDGGVQHGDFKEIAPRMAEEWRSLTEDGWCAVSVNTRYIISLESNVSRKPGVEDLIRSNPRVVLGARYERGKRYAFTNNPESISTILLTVDEEQIKQLENQLKEIGLKAGRICCGTYAMLRRMLETVHTTETKDADKNAAALKGNCLDIICCEGSVCVMMEHGDLWTELRSRTDIYKEADYQAVFEILQPLLSRLDSTSSIRFSADNADSPILQELRTRLPETPITDFSSPDYFWKVLADL